MNTTKWQVSGEYFETCSCDFLCPCIPANLAARPTQGDCTFAMVYRIDRGNYGNVNLDGLIFAVLGNTPGVMGQGNWSVGLITDERATPEQQQALIQIGSGQGGGPMSNLAPLVSNFLGVETRPIKFKMDGLNRSVSIPGVLDEAVVGVPSAAVEGEPLYIENTVHPANSRLALARSTGSHLHALGLDWDDTSGNNNGHFAPFNWQAG